MNPIDDADDPDCESRNLPKATLPAMWQIVSLWSFGLLVLTVICSFLIFLIGPYVLAPFFSNGRFAVYLFRCLPLIFITVWLTGSILACRRYQSFKVLGYLTAVGCLLFLTSPIWMYLIVIASVGGWNVGK